MVVNRIKSIDIQSKGLFTAIYGQVNDLFMGSDLRKYSFYQQLYVYLKQEGFDSVIFYDPTNRSHSYGEKDLILYLKHEIQASSEDTLRKYAASHVDSPLRGSLRTSGLSTASTQDISNNPNLPIEQKHKQDIGNKFYYHSGNIDILPRFKNLFYNNSFKLALIIRTPSNTDFKQPEEFGSFFDQLENDFKLQGIQHKILVIYGGKTSADCLQQFKNNPQSKTFFLPFFQSHFIKYSGGEIPSRSLSEQCIRITEPEQDEIANFIDYHRIVSEYPISFSDYEKLVRNLYRGDDNNIYTGSFLSEIKQQKFEEMIGRKKMTGLEELEEMIGLDFLKGEIRAMVNASKFQLKKGSDFKVSRHIVLTGNPGTGKTEVARLIGQIFQEEGLLRRGQFIAAKLSDLKGNVVGETPIKTQSVIERALGGVLFIDEAYQIASSEGETDNFSKELVATLLQEMEDRRGDLLVIVSGYQEEMDNFLASNPGLSSRFPYNFHFSDYNEKELLKIFEVMVRKENWETAPDFMECIGAVILDIYKREGTKSKFGNARTIRNLVDKVRTQHDNRCIRENIGDDIYKVEDIPEIYLRYIKKPKTDVSESFEELNSLIGLKGVKMAIEQIVTNLKFDERRKELGLIKDGEIQDLNFVFSGNPGTGKTTVARLLGNIMQEIGVLKSGHVVEVSREKLVAGYVGQTASKTRKKIDEALNGVLFIDEAYSLLIGGDFGHEVIDQLLVTATDPKYVGKVSIIVAGYPDHMNQFIASNPGLFRRLPQIIYFEDYSSEDLVLIFEKNLTHQNFILGEGVKERAYTYFESIPRNEMFGNAGTAVRLVSIAKANLNKRLLPEAGKEELMTVQVDDIPGFAPLVPTPVGADSLALEVLPNFNPNNPTDVFIKNVCDEIQEVVLHIIDAFEGGEGFLESIDKIEDEKLHQKIMEVLKMEGQYNLALFREITEGIKSFGLFFRGISHFNHNQIAEAIRYLKDSLKISQEYNIGELKETTTFLIGYWEILLQLKDNKLDEVKFRLKHFKESLASDNVGVHFKEMSDMIQADILFVTALNAISNTDLNGFTESIIAAAETVSKIAEDYHEVGQPSFKFFKGLSDFYESYKNIITIFYNIENNDFTYTNELVNLSIHTQRFKSYFKDFDLTINPRLENMNHLMAGFAQMEDFFQSLSIVANRYHSFNVTPSELEIKQLKHSVKNASDEIAKVNDEESRAWIEICDSLINYVSEFGSGNAQDLDLTRSYGHLHQPIGGLDAKAIEKESNLPFPQAIRSIHNFFTETGNIQSTLTRLVQFARRLDDEELKNEIEIQKIQFFWNMEELQMGTELREHTDVKRNRMIVFLYYTINKLIQRFPLS